MQLFRKENDNSTQPLKKGLIWLDGLYQHIETLKEHFEEDSTDSDTKNSGLNAKTIPLNIANFADSGCEGDSTSPLHVPTFSLIPHNSLLIDEVTLDFECILTEYSTSSADQQGRLALRLSRSDTGYAGMPARISVRYKMGTPPEGMARINDGLTTRIP
jgi:hypothetical protein